MSGTLLVRYGLNTADVVGIFEIEISIAENDSRLRSDQPLDMRVITQAWTRARSQGNPAVFKSTDGRIVCVNPDLVISIEEVHAT